MKQSPRKGTGMREWRFVAVVAAALIAGTAQAQTTSPGLPGDDRSGAVGSGAAVARMDARMSQLEQDLRGVTGRVESLGYQVRQLNDRVERLASDLDLQMNELRAAAGHPPGATASTAAEPRSTAGGPTVLSRGGGEPEPARPTPPAAASPQPPAQATPAPPTTPAPESPAASARGTLPAGSSKEQYAYAFSLMQKASYAEATAAFSEFLERNPSDSLADNARYWLGESYYARNEYARAAETFLDAYEKNKTGPKAPETLLKLGMALGKLDKKKEACASFRELSRSFPNATAQIKDKASQESQRIGCS